MSTYGGFYQYIDRVGIPIQELDPKTLPECPSASQVPVVGDPTRPKVVAVVQEEDLFDAGSSSRYTRPTPRSTPQPYQAVPSTTLGSRNVEVHAAAGQRTKGTEREDRRTSPRTSSPAKANARFHAVNTRPPAPAQLPPVQSVAQSPAPIQPLPVPNVEVHAPAGGRSKDVQHAPACQARHPGTCQRLPDFRSKPPLPSVDVHAAAGQRAGGRQDRRRADQRQGGTAIPSCPSVPSTQARGTDG